MLEEVQEGIVTRRNLAGGLAYPHITGELREGDIEGTYAEEGVDSSKQNTCRWEGDLARLSQKILDGMYDLPGPPPRVGYPRIREGRSLPG